LILRHSRQSQFDANCRSAHCPPEKARLRLSDSGNLYLQVEPNGSRRWFWKYTAGGKEKRISLGHYTEAGSSKVQTSLRKKSDQLTSPAVA
jgi:hypothetical protein